MGTGGVRMIFTQYYLRCLAHASYLVGDAGSRTAAVVDPQRDVDQYLEDARRAGLEIRHVILTHFHADFVAGHLELRNRAGARIYLGRRARAEYAFTGLGDGDVIEFGSVRLAALETPGHSPESISLLVYDLARSDRTPRAVLTGDTLFIGDVGRPDLRAALGWSAEELAGMLYDSLRTKLLALPDETLVYPTHGAGSLCGRNISTETVSTIGVQRRYNYALQPMSREDFIRIVTADQPDAPSYFTYDAILNTKERPTLDATLKEVLQPLGLEEVLRLRNAGAQILDARDPAEYAGAHLVDSLNIGLGGQYASWAGTLLDRDRPIVIVADPGREAARTHRVRPRRGVPRGRHGGARCPSGPPPPHRAHGRRDAGRAPGLGGGAARPGRADGRGAPGGADPRQRAHPPGAPGRAARRSAPRGPADRRPLRHRLSLLDRGEPPRAARVRRGQRSRRRHRRLEGLAAPHRDRGRMIRRPARGGPARPDA